MSEKSAAKTTKRINVEIAPGIRKALDALLEQEKVSTEKTKVSLTYTDVINQALMEVKVAQVELKQSFKAAKAAKKTVQEVKESKVVENPGKASQPAK